MIEPQRLANITRRLSLRDRLRIESYLTRLEWHLEGTLSGTSRRSIVRTLREDLAIEPRSVSAALRDLGPASLLAAQYADDAAPRPLWSIGIITAGAALLVYWILFFTYTLGMLAVIDQNALQEAHSVFLFIQVTAFSSDAAIGIGWTGGMAWLVVPFILLVIAYALGARLWRLVYRHRP